MKDCIYLTVEQIDALHDLAHTSETSYGKVRVGVQLMGDADSTTGVQLAAVMTDDDTSHSFIGPDGACTGWER